MPHSMQVGRIAGREPWVRPSPGEPTDRSISRVEGSRLTTKRRNASSNFHGQHPQPTEIKAARQKALTSKFIFATILGHDGGLADEEARMRLALFYAKTRLGWNSVASCHEEVGDPTDAQAVQQKLSDELDRLAQRLKTGETGGSSKA